MSLVRPELLAALVLLLPAAALARAALARARRDALEYGVTVARRAWPELLAAAVLVLGAAGPELGRELLPVRVAGLDVAVAIDASRSMLCADVAPTRLARACREARDLARHLEGGRLALASFGGAGALRCPLTHDRASFASFVDRVDPALEPSGGSSVAAGLLAALDALPVESGARRAVVLLSDGGGVGPGDLEALESAAWRARAAGVVVHAVLIGTRAGAPVPRDLSGGAEPMLDDSGAIVVSRAEPAALERAAAITGGRFVAGDREPFALERLAAEAFGADGATGGEQLREEPVNRFRWCAAGALLLLLLGSALERRAGRLAAAARAPLRPAAARVALALLAPAALGFAGAEQDCRAAAERFAAGDYAAARELYFAASRERPESAEISFDLGLSCYRAEDFERAALEFDRARVLAEGRLAATAAFAAGCARFRIAAARAAADAPPRAVIGPLALARRHFAEAVIGGHGRDAAVNLELASRLLEEATARASAEDARGRSGEAGDSDGARSDPAAGDPAAADQDPSADDTAAGAPEGQAKPSDRRSDAGRSREAPAGAAGEDARLDGGMFRERAVDLFEIVQRYERLRDACDRRAALAVRGNVKEDW